MRKVYRTQQWRSREISLDELKLQPCRSDQRETCMPQIKLVDFLERYFLAKLFLLSHVSSIAPARD